MKNNKLKLLPFNLEEALANPERVVYRSGIKPLEWHYFKTAKKCNNIVAVRGSDSEADFYNNIGKFSIAPSSPYDLMLLPLPDKITKVYQDVLYKKDSEEPLYIESYICTTLEDAKEIREDHSIAIVEIAYNETTKKLTCKIVHNYEKDTNN